MRNEATIEAQRRELMQLLASFEFMPILLLLPDTLTVYWASEGAARLLGYSREQLQQTTLYELAVAERTELEARLAPSELPSTLTLTVRLANGEEHTLRGVAQQLPEHQLLCIGHVDITDLYLPYVLVRDVANIPPQQTGLALLRHYARSLSKTLGTAHVYIGRIVDVNRVEGVIYAVGGELLPPPNYSLRGTPCADVVTRGVCMFPQGVQALFPEDEMLREARIESYIGTPLRDPLGRVIGIFWIADTKPTPNYPTLVELFQVLAVRFSHELLRDQAEAEAQLLREQLLQAQKMESIGRMAGGLAHDFNNMLTAILGYVELAQGALPENSPAQSFLKNAITAIEKASSIARQLMTLARQQPMQLQLVNLNQVVREALQLARTWMPASIQLQTFLADNLWLVEADPAQLGQVLQNLLLNARDAMMQTGGVITIETQNTVLDTDYARTHYDVVPGEYVLLMVSDTGAGMSPEVQARIFEPFFTTKPPEQGTGLGLSVVYSVVKQLGGHIWVYSEEGRGTTFKIYLPRAYERAPMRPQETLATAPLPRGSETVLVVEDEPSVLEVATEVLRQHGYTVLSAASPGDALRIAQEYHDPIHLLITDVVMPVMSGRELADYILRLHPQIRVLYVSGYTENTIVHQGILEEGIHFLPKPYTPAQLLRKVREVLESEPSA